MAIMRAIQVQSAANVHELESRAAANRCEVFRVDLATVDSKSKLIRAIAEAMRLPAYCGTNWDGLEECLRDLPEDKGWLLIFENADQLERLDKSQLAAFLSILSDTAKFWEEEGHSFRVILVGGPSLVAAVEGMP